MSDPLVDMARLARVADLEREVERLRELLRECIKTRGELGEKWLAEREKSERQTLPRRPRPSAARGAEAMTRYTQYFGVEATGSRIGLCVCRDCGATILLGDEQADSMTIHNKWHDGEPKPDAGREEK
jgi:hypothetical protein